MKKRSPSFSSLHGQLTNEVQNGVSIARPYDSLGHLAFVDLNAEAQSRREIECQPVAYSALVADKAATSWQNYTFSIFHPPFACAPTNRHPYTVSYAYDHRGRMVSKRITENDGSDTLVKSISYLWDGWNIIRETATDGNGSTTVTDNVWGLDLDGSLQGAGGVGGLLAVVRDGEVYLPAYDANGNISEYVTTNGTVVAHYDYSPFGETLIESGDLAATFTHRFSTKPWCPVTGLMVDRDELIKELVSMCPISMITAWKTVCCMDDCVTEATNIANAIYDAVKKNQTLAHGCFGNLLNTTTGGHFAHGCLEWQEIVLQGYREGIRRNNHGRPKCFLSAGVAEFYPFTDWTRHNWVIIYGPNVPTVLSKDLIAEPGIHVDPWPSGGSGLFPEKPRPIDAILLPPEV